MDADRLATQSSRGREINRLAARHRCSFPSFCTDGVIDRGARMNRCGAGRHTVANVHEIGRRQRNQPAPPQSIFEALTELDRPGARPWLDLLDDEQRPRVLSARAPSTVIWSSIWIKRPDAVIEFDLSSDGGGGTDLCWTLLVDHPSPDCALVGHMRKRMNMLINASLRYSLGQ